MIHDLSTQEGRNKYAYAMSFKTLTSKQIAEHLLTDSYSYEDTIKGMLIKHLESLKSERVYWDTWFRGAEGKDLEDADKG